MKPTMNQALNAASIWNQSIQNAIEAAHLPQPLGNTEKQTLRQEIKDRLKRENAVLVAHYYTDPELQSLAEETGGFVSDSLEMARFGSQHPAQTLVVAGVKFMGETAKILNPEKRVLMPDLKAECSLDLGCAYEPFSEFCDQYPDRRVVVYANTSAEVKARADWVVTSGIALDIVRHLHDQGEKIVWGPDKYLGDYIQKQTGADMILWNASCVVHESFKETALQELRKLHPEAAVLVHPESPASIIAQADCVGSTTALIKAAKELPATSFIVATEPGIFYKMKQVAPEKTFVMAPTGGTGATCQSCAYCPWMAMNSLTSLATVLKTGNNEIQIPEPIRIGALVAVQRMMDFAKNRKTVVSQP